MNTSDNFEGCSSNKRIRVNDHIYLHDQNRSFGIDLSSNICLLFLYYLFFFALLLLSGVELIFTFVYLTFLRRSN
jgi:hypothetical protein